MSNWKLGKVQYTFLETVTAGGLLTLVNESAMFQIFTGATSHTLRLPDATTMFDVGEEFVVINESTGSISIQNAGGIVIATVLPAGIVEIYLSDKSTANGVWRAAVAGSTGASGLMSQGPGTAKNSGAVGLFGGGNTGAVSNVIDYVQFSSLTNAQDFGDLTVARSYLAGLGSGTRGVFVGGDNVGTRFNTMDYVTFAVAGNATDFGDLTANRAFLSATGGATRGIIGGGYEGSNPGVNTIEYITIASVGNSLDFGDLTAARYELSAMSSRVRSIFAGGATPTAQSTMDYITIATLGNAASFGSLSASRYGLASCSNSVRGLNGGGNGPVTTVDTIILATLGNATTYGSLVTARVDLAAVSSENKAAWGGGSTGSPSNVMDYMTFAASHVTVDFGDLTVARQELAGCSNSHGGLA